MRRPGEIEDVKKKIHARARKVLWHGPVAVDGVRLEVAARNSAREKGEQKDE